MTSQCPQFESPESCTPRNGVPALSLHAVALDKQQVLLYAARKATRWIFVGQYETGADDALRCVFRCSAFTDLVSVSVNVSVACTVRIYCDGDPLYDGTGALDEGTAALAIVCPGPGWHSLPFQRLAAAADGDSCALQPGVTTAESDVILWLTIDTGILYAATVRELSYADTLKALTTGGVTP